MIQPGNDLPLIPSATVLLIRPDGEGFQVYLIRRSRDSSFMGGLFVFPGGVVEPEDRDAAFWFRHVDMAGDAIDLRFGGDLSTDRAMAYCVAAIRETAEESGVLLARNRRGAPVFEDRTGLRRERTGPPARWMQELVEANSWKLALSSLFRWSRWITPVGMKKRFDTRFFLAVMPEEQRCRPDQRETVQGLWAAPREGLEGNLRGTIPLSPPTVVTLDQLSAFERFSELMDEARSRRWGEAIRPRMVKLTEGALIVEPWDPVYDENRIEIDAERLAASVLGAGKPFSRIWLRKGRALPVSTE